MFLYTSNNSSENETKKIIPFTITTKPVAYLGINLTKEVKEQITENYKTLIKEIKEEINNRFPVFID